MNGSFSQPKSPDSWWFDYFLMVALSKNHWFICQTQQNNSINLRFRVSVGNRLSRTWPGAQMAGSGWSKLSWMKTRVPTLIIVDSSLAINYRLHILKSHSCPGPQITFFVRSHRFLAAEEKPIWLNISILFPHPWGRTSWELVTPQSAWLWPVWRTRSPD